MQVEDSNTMNQIEPQDVVQGVIRFASGAVQNSAKHDFMRAFNRHDHSGAARILETRRDEFTAFQLASMNGLLAVEQGDIERAERAFDHAKECAANLMERAIVFENRSYLKLKLGQWDDARALCEEGIRACGSVEGLYVNLLAALDRLGAEDEIRTVLETIPGIFPLDHGALRLHLIHDPDLDGIRRHPEFETVRALLEPKRR